MRNFTPLSNVVLACVILRIIVATNTLHAQTPPGGTDSDSNGLIDIRTIEQLNNMRHNLAGTSYKDADGATGVTTGCPAGECNGYELLNNLDFAQARNYESGAVDLAFRPLTDADPTISGATVQADPADGLNPGFVPIGVFTSGDATTTFTGNFNGNGFEIHNLYINTAVIKEAGFFGYTGGGSTIQNIGVIDAYVRNSSGESNSSTGVLAGVFATTTIQNCYATGNVTMSNGRSSNIGGLAGFIGAIAILQNSYAAVTVLETGSGNNLTGGLVGNNLGTIKNCYATGAVSGSTSAHTGGLVGSQQSGMIQNCYATGAVTDGTFTGGLVGSSFRSTITNSYFDATTTKQARGVGTKFGGIGTATSLTTEKLQELTATTSTTESERWSENDWNFGTTSQYPALRSYVTATGGTTQVAGTVLTNQPCPRVDCPPTLISSLTTASTATNAGSALVETSATAIAYNLGEVQTGGTATFIYTLSGVSLTGNVTLAVGGTDPTAFSITPSADLVPSSGAITATQITVTFTPTEERIYEATIMHSGGGLADDVVLLLTGMGTPPPTLTLETGSPSAAIPSNTYDFGNVITPVTTAPTFVYTIEGANLTGNVTLAVGGTDPTAFSITPSADLVPSSGAITATQITVTFTPTDLRIYEATITHSGGGLVDDVVLLLTGTGTPPPPGGTDSDSDGLIDIRTIEQLNNMRHNLAGTSYKDADGATGVTTGCPTGRCNGYELLNDLDFADDASYSGSVDFAFRPLTEADPTTTGATVQDDPADGLNPGFVPIGVFTSGDATTTFTGNFNGNGFEIHNLYINTTVKEAGFFGYTGGGSTIQNIGVIDVYVHSSSGEENSEVGVLAGRFATTIIQNCYATGNVTMSNGRFSNIGGLAGSTSATAILQNSYAAVTVLETGSGSNGTGGLVGNNLGTIKNCYATGTVSGSTSAHTGGLVGSQQSGMIQNCYATGAVTDGVTTGGLVGSSFRSTITNSYFDATTTKQALGMGTSTGTATSLTTEKLQELTATTTSTIESERWSENDWNFGTTSQYPALRSYATATGGTTQVAGNLLVNQPCPRVGCPPTLISSLTTASTATNAGSAFVETSATAIAYNLGEVQTGGTVTFTYTLSGSSLTGNITLAVGETDPTAFSIAPSADLVPSSGAITATQITVTFTPTEERMYEATITHSGGGLSSDVVLTLIGTGTLETDSDSDGLIDIRTIEQLNNMRHNLAGTSYKDASGATGVTTGCPTGGCNGYELLNDLDFAQARNYESGSVDLAFRPLTETAPTTAGATVQDDPADGLNPGFVPIGDSATRFTGNFNGNGFEISNLYINTAVEEVGFFGQTGGRNTIQNIGVIDAYVRSAGESNSSAGVLAGLVVTTTIQNCYATGNITMSNKQFSIGGLVGFINTRSILQNSYAAVTVLQTGRGSNTGGLVGVNNGTIKNCYATGAVTGGTSIGGLVGNDSGTIKNCYATGAVTGSGRAGGFVGSSFNVITNSYFDATTTKQVLGIGESRSGSTGTATSLTTEKLQELTATTTLTTESEIWSENDWDFGTTSQYPALRSYATAMDGTTQVSGNVLVNQPCPRVDCPPTLISSLTTASTATNAGSALVETSATAIAYNLGEVQTGGTATFTYTLSGVSLTGNVTLAVGGTDPTAFSIVPSADLIPSSRGSITATQITVTFTPTEERMYEATITHSGGGLADDVVLTLTGTGTPPPTLTLETGNPLLAIPSNTYDFRNVITPVTTAPTFVYTIKGANLTGNITLSIGGTDPTAFSIAPSSDLTPSSGAITATQITVTFTPTEERIYEATITHSGGGLSSDVVLTLTGTSTPPPTLTLETGNPSAAIPSNTYDFRNVITPVTTAPTFVYTIKGANLTGNVTLAVGGTDPTAFSITPSADLVPSSGAITTTQITVTFTPTEERIYEATITHSGGGLSSDVVLTLTGTGTLPPPTLTLETGNPSIAIPSNTYDFGNVITPVTTAPTFVYTIKGANLTGNVTLAVGGTDPTAFSITPSADLVPSSGAITTTQITVTFTPTEERIYEATITHSGGGLVDDVVLTLTGTGTDPTVPRLTLTPMIPATLTGTVPNYAHSFGNVITPITTAPTFVYTIEGANLTGSITLAVGGTDATAFSIAPSADLIPLSGAITATQITVTFTPTEERMYEAIITHSGGGLVDDVVLTLTGTGTPPPTLTLETGNPPVAIPSNTYDFGNVITNVISSTTAPTFVYTITGANLTGDVTLAVGGTDPTAFSIAPSADLVPSSGAITATQITVTFTPTEERMYEATITHSGGGLADDVVLLLTGTGTPPPTLTLETGNPPVAIPSNAYSFGNVTTPVTTAPTFVYTITGANLTGDVTLAVGGTDATAFSIAPSADLVPSSGTITATQITVTFTPTEERMYEATITHSGGGLADDVVLLLTGTGTPPPTLTLETGNPPVAIPSNAYSFGNVITPVTTAPTFVYTITGANLTGDVTLAVGGTDATAFSIAPSADLVPSSGAIAATQITVTFTPTEERTYEATITHSGGGLSSDVVLLLTGTGTDPTAPRLTLMPMIPANFTGTVPNYAYSFRNVTTPITTAPTFVYMIEGVNLTGDVTLSIGGTDSTAFSIAPSADLVPSSGAITATQITVTFTPTEERIYEATITHSGGGLSDDVVLLLTGTGTPPPPTLTLETGNPSIAIPSNTYDFGNVITPVTTAPTFVYTIEGANLTGDITLAVGGTDPTAFSIAPSADLIPSSGAITATQITVTFTPTERRMYEATITHSGGGLSPDVVLTLTGTSYPPTLTLETGSPSVAIPSNTYDFGNAITPVTTFVYTIEGANLTGNVTLSIGGTDPTAFSIAPSADLIPSSGAITATQITVTFTPTEERMYEATVTHSGGGLADDVVLTLTGTGTTGTDTTVGIEDNTINAIDIRLYPNPSRGRLFVHGEGTFSVSVRNLLGVELLRQEIVEANTIDLSALQAGLYFVQVQGDNGSFIQRIIKK